MPGAIKELTIFRCAARVHLVLMIEADPRSEHDVSPFRRADGRRAGFAAVAGVASGLLLIGLLAAFGVAALISDSRILYDFSVGPALSTCSGWPTTSGAAKSRQRPRAKPAGKA